VSPVLRAFCTTLNDSLEDGPRQRLRPYLVRTIGTVDDGLDETRSWLALDWLIRTYAPTWLRLAGLVASADRLAAQAPITGSASLEAALDGLQRACRESHSAWLAALGAPRAVAWAPWIAGRTAAREAAWASAGAAAWAAARVGVGDLAGDRARALSRDIAGDAAATMSREARTGAGRAAARDAARVALAPTLAQLRASALELLDRMLPTVPLAAPVAVDAEQVCAAPPVAAPS
jgi:hypothetical protein